MKVFVWATFNSVTVYKADTVDDIMKIITVIDQVNECHGHPLWDISVVDDVYELRKVVMAHVEDICNDPKDDRFRYGSGFKDVLS